MAFVTTIAERASPVTPATPLKMPTILVFDSGLGGLSVFREVTRQRPDAHYVYAADDAAFPYGELSDAALVSRVAEVMDDLIAESRPDLVVIACNTASTLALPTLRERHNLPFVGTVPAVKPACAASLSRKVSVLGTPGTIRRDYTASLVREFAGGCRVDLVPCERLAGLAEAAMAGEAVDDDAIAAEIRASFVEDAHGRTDTVVLACTHYPLILDRLAKVAPWPVNWIDPAPAIARRVVQLLGPSPIAAPSEAPVRAITTKRALDGARVSAIIGRAVVPEVLPVRLPAVS